MLDTLIQKTLMIKVQLKQFFFLLGLIDKQLDKNWSFVFVNENCMKIIRCSKVEKFLQWKNGSTSYSGRTVGGDKGTCRTG